MRVIIIAYLNNLSMESVGSQEYFDRIIQISEKGEEAEK